MQLFRKLFTLNMIKKSVACLALALLTTASQAQVHDACHSKGWQDVIIKMTICNEGECMVDLLLEEGLLGFDDESAYLFDARCSDASACQPLAARFDVPAKVKLDTRKWQSTNLTSCYVDEINVLF